VRLGAYLARCASLQGYRKVMLCGFGAADFVGYPLPRAISPKVFKADTLGLDFESEKTSGCEDAART